MKRILLEYLVCPGCKKDLTCETTAESRNEIESGSLHCRQCQRDYPIVRGIPRFVTRENPLAGQNVETADAFGWEWQEFTELHDMDTYKAQFLDWVHPIQPAFLADKVVLDAGCGMGRFSMVSSHFGAKMVLAIDASDAVEAAQENARHLNNVHVIQGSIHDLPLRCSPDGQMDFIFSIGVLHHLDDPQAGFNDLACHLRPSGSIFAWVYGRENNGWLVNFVNPVRTLLTSRLPRGVLYGLSWLITAVLHPIVRFIYRPINASNSLRGLSRFLFYNDYMTWLGQYSFRHNHHVVFDHLVAPVAYYLRREEFTSWFDEANLEIIDMSWRNQNSWRGHGQPVGSEQ